MGTLVSVEQLGEVIGYRKDINGKVWCKVKFKGASFAYDELELNETSILPVEAPRE